MKLGGQALSLVALLERRRVTRDTSLDPLINDLATFMLAMEVKKEPGRYHQSYDPQRRKMLLTPDSDYYPGECLLALTRLAVQFPDGPYLEAAKRAAAYLIHVRDGDIPARGAIPREDHWLAMALSELYRLDPNPAYATVAYLQAETMVRNQYTSADGIPARVGGSRTRNPINYTSTATKGEALVAVWSLAAFRQDQPAVERFGIAARRNAQFQMRVQYTRANTPLSAPGAAYWRLGPGHRYLLRADGLRAAQHLSAHRRVVDDQERRSPVPANLLTRRWHHAVSGAHTAREHPELVYPSRLSQQGLAIAADEQCCAHSGFLDERSW